MVPFEGLINPEMTLKTVVFPAPFGPMRPLMEPGSTSISRLDNASRASKRTVRS